MFKKIVLIILCFSLVVAASGCNPNEKTEPNPTPEPAVDKTDTTMIDFSALIQNDSPVAEVADFINNNIANVSQEDATRMVVEFEKVQKKSLSQLENLYNEDDIQNMINSEYERIIAQIELKDTELKHLLAKTENSGYKVETAEGQYFPIIDYRFYKKYSTYVTADLKDYLDIMVVESDQVPAKDAALVISWDEVLNRALNQEKFINNHKDSPKVDEIRELYKKYVTFTLFGLNNTPLFSYDAKTINPEAKEIYLEAVAGAGSSEYLKILAEFLDLIKNNNYKLTDKAVQYRENVMENLTK